MVLDNLEKRLEKTGDLEDFNRRISKLEDDVRYMIKLLLGLAYEFHLNGLEKDYVVFGGYSVLIHLINAIGTEVIERWRGTYDIDIVVSKKARTVLKSQLNVISDRRSPNEKGKRTIKVKLDEVGKVIQN